MLTFRRGRIFASSGHPTFFFPGPPGAGIRLPTASFFLPAKTSNGGRSESGLLCCIRFRRTRRLWRLFGRELSALGFCVLPRFTTPQQRTIWDCPLSFHLPLALHGSGMTIFGGKSRGRVMGRRGGLFFLGREVKNASWKEGRTRALRTEALRGGPSILFF